MKKREEAWSKIDCLAKQNPTYEQVADSVAASWDQYWLYADHYDPYTDDDDLLDEDSDYLLEKKKCDYEVRSR